ncbi:MAG TPA: hypothetical protein VE951_02445 [Candidatus Angelobacter sp.]|jgi:hypothetical protein|nr:hypothetical protein [Candidatus Angelobacter sp.]
MSTAREIADQSMRLAADFTNSARDRLLEMADRDTDLLREAADVVRRSATEGPSLSHSAEHLAFSLITAAHNVLVEENQRRVDETLRRQ